MAEVQGKCVNTGKSDFFRLDLAIPADKCVWSYFFVFYVYYFSFSFVFSLFFTFLFITGVLSSSLKFYLFFINILISQFHIPLLILLRKGS